MSRSLQTGESHAAPGLAHQFDDLTQQRDAATLGMWAFLATEVMFFGGALFAYALYRSYYPEAFAAASRLENWWIGMINTGVLLCSSFTVVLAVLAAERGDRRGIVLWFGATIFFGVAFLGIKAYEYTHLYHEGVFPLVFAPVPELEEHLRTEEGLGELGPVWIFFAFYFALTGLHALHMIIGIGVIGFVMWMAHRGRFTKSYYNPVEVTGLYWHFVDIVWIFLYPLFYLIDRT